MSCEREPWIGPLFEILLAPWTRGLPQNDCTRGEKPQIIEGEAAYATSDLSKGHPMLTHSTITGHPARQNSAPTKGGD
jgi:hypothetical protein